jgi:hypothetical protein
VVWLDAEGDGRGLIVGHDDQKDEQAACRCDCSSKTPGDPCLELAGRPGAGQQPHDEAEVVASHVDQVALVQVLPAAQPGATQAADVEDEGEAALDLFGAQFSTIPSFFSQ